MVVKEYTFPATGSLGGVLSEIKEGMWIKYLDVDYLYSVKIQTITQTVVNGSTPAVDLTFVDSAHFELLPPKEVYIFPDTLGLLVGFGGVQLGGTHDTDLHTTIV